MKRRDFLKISAIISGGIISGISLISKDEFLNAKNSANHFPHPGGLIIFKDDPDLICYVISVNGNEVKVKPIKSNMKITKKHLKMDFVVVCSAFPEGSTE